jgi:hypothetical protein
MCIGDCIICNKTLFEGDVAKGIPHTDVFYCYNCINHIQPERASERDRKVCGAPNTPTKGSESSRND